MSTLCSVSIAGGEMKVVAFIERCQMDQLRIIHRFNLPDAIIAPSAQYIESTIITRDVQMLKCEADAAVSW